MTSPAHVSLAGVSLAIVFGGSMLALLLWMLRVPRPVSAGAAQARRSPEDSRVILVPVTRPGNAQRGVELAARLAKEQQAAILLVYVIEVPWTLPLGAKLEQADQEAQAALETAREVVARHHLPVRTIIKRAREVGAGITEAARDYEVDLVLTNPGSRERRGRLQWWRTATR